MSVLVSTRTASRSGFVAGCSPLLLCVCVSLAACSSEPAGSGGTSEGEVSERDVDTADAPIRDIEIPEDVGSSDVASADADAVADAPTEDIRVDSFVDDGFTRPDAIPDAGDDADVAVQDTEPEDAAEDIPPQDVQPNAAIDETGTVACLEWTIRAEYDVFDFKGSDFLVTYAVTNRCSESFLYRVEHMNDMFPLAVHKDGELWTYLGLCPGQGPPFEWTFRTVGEGISRGFVWRVAEHESLLTDCGVEFDAEATYELVGYGSTEIDTFSTFSTPYPLTPAYPITIRE